VNNKLHERACPLCLARKGSTATPLSAEEFVEELFAIHAPRLVSRPTLNSLLTKAPKIKVKEKSNGQGKGGGRS
jgi:hypothetical protein